MLWGAAYGYIQYVVYIAATDKLKSQSQDWLMKVLLDPTSPLAEDFPELVLPFISCNGQPASARHKTWKGEPAHLSCSTEQIVTAHQDVPWGRCSQRIFEFASMEGAIRGRNYAVPGGGTLRPDLVIADDPQTKAVARSNVMVDNYEEIVMSEIAYLGSARSGGCGIIVPCTKIVKNCLASRLLDRERHPEFQGETRQFFIQMPTNMAAWEKYNEVLQDCRLQEMSKKQISEVTNAYYKKHRKQLDAGAEVAWEYSFDQKYEISAIQHGMNRYFKDPAAFFAEYQNEPQETSGATTLKLDSGQLMRRHSGLPKGVLPDETAFLVGAIDISQDVLWWLVAAFQQDLTCCVVNYGVFPSQNKRYVSLSTIDTTLRGEFRKLQKKENPNGRIDASISAGWRFGLESLLTAFTENDWVTESGNAIAMSKVIIDTNYHRSTDTVIKMRKRSRWKEMIIAAKGQGTSLKKPNLWNPTTKKKKGERRGHHWRFMPGEDGQIFHPGSNAWKSIVYESLSCVAGDPGSTTLYTPPEGRSAHHQMIADQWSAETGSVQKNENTELTVWIENGTDNHLWDCLYMAFATASTLGCHRPDHKEAGAVKPVSKRRRSLQQLFDENNPGYSG